MPWLCRQSDPVGWLCVHWGVRSTKIRLAGCVSIGKYVAHSTTYFPMDTQPANRIWLPTQPRHYTTREKIPLSRQLLKMCTRWPETCWATYKEQPIRRNKYNTEWHLVGLLFHIVTVVCNRNSFHEFLQKMWCFVLICIVPLFFVDIHRAVVLCWYALCHCFLFIYIVPLFCVDMRCAIVLLLLAVLNGREPHSVGN